MRRGGVFHTYGGVHPMQRATAPSKFFRHSDAGLAGGSPSADLARRLDHLIEWLVVALVSFAPWPLGSVHAWPQEVVIAASALLAGCFSAKLLIIRQTRLVRSWTYLPIALFVSLALFQLVPLPHALLRVISSNTLQIKSQLLSDLPDAAGASMPLTFYANATRNNLRLLLVCVVIFVVALNVLRTPGRIKRVLIAISTVGGLVILLALAQDMTGTQKIYWIIAKPIPLAVGGPFVGHNDFPLFANLTIGAAVSLLMLMRAERRASRSEHPMSTRRIAANCALVAVIALGACAVFLSLSRSGIISLGVASICIAVVAAIRSRLPLDRWMMAACLLACFVVSFYFASDSVNQRLATLQHPFEQGADRLQIVRDILAEWPKFPLFGTGLGTHEVVYPMFQRLPLTTNFDHAENEFAQMLEETGALGLGIILLFVGLIAAAFFRAANRSTHAPIGATTFGLGLGLLAVTIQSCFGFGAHVLANAMLMAVECAILLNVLRLLERAQRGQVAAQVDTTGPRIPALGFALRLAGVVAVLIAFVPALADADRASGGEAEWEPARVALFHSDFNGSLRGLGDENFQDSVASAQSAHQAEPDNVKYLYWQAQFAWEALESKHDPNVADDVRPDAEMVKIRRFVEELNRVRKICPTYGSALLLAGQLQYLALDEPRGLDLIHLASQVAPTNLNVFLQIAAIDCDRGDFAGAIAAFRHYLSLQGMQHGNFDTVVEFLVTQYKRPDLAMQLAGSDPERQLSIASALRKLHDRADFQALAATLQAKAMRIETARLIDACQSPDASAADLAELAEIYRSENKLPESVEYYQRALRLNYGQVEWRLNLAQAMLAAGQANDAEREAGLCLRLQPQMDAARQVIAAATTQPSYRAQQ